MVGPLGGFTKPSHKVFGPVGQILVWKWLSWSLGTISGQKILLGGQSMLKVGHSDLQNVVNLSFLIMTERFSLLFLTSLKLLRSNSNGVEDACSMLISPSKLPHNEKPKYNTQNHKFDFSSLSGRNEKQLEGGIHTQEKKHCLFEPTSIPDNGSGCLLAPCGHGPMTFINRVWPWIQIQGLFPEQNYKCVTN